MVMMIVMNHVTPSWRWFEMCLLKKDLVRRSSAQLGRASYVGKQCEEVLAKGAKGKSNQRNTAGKGQDEKEGEWATEDNITKHVTHPY